MESEDNVITVSPNLSFLPFEEMRERRELCDITINLENHSFTAHKVVIAAGIPYFRSLLTGTEQKNEMKLNSLADLDPSAVESLLCFAYGSQLNISAENALPLLVASHALTANLVFAACVEFLSKISIRNVNSISNVVGAHLMAQQLEISDLIGSTRQFILNNFEKVATSEDFATLPHTYLVEILSDDDLSVSKEESVFEAVLTWINKSPQDRKEILPRMLSEVRMIYFHPEYLINRVAAELIISNSGPCMKLVEKVKNYLIFPQNQSLASELKIQPRKSYYTNGGIYAVFDCQGSGYAVYHCNFDNRRISHVLKHNEGTPDKILGVAAVGEKIYLFHEKTIRTLDVKSFEWEVLKPTHLSMDGAAVVPHGNKIYCIGSCASEFSNKVRCFDTLEKKWLAEGKTLFQRYSSAAACLEEVIYVTGGSVAKFDVVEMPLFPKPNGENSSRLQFNAYPFEKAVEVYSPVKNKSDIINSPMLVSRWNHFSFGLTGKVYVVGGDREDARRTAEMYDPIINQWNYISSLPVFKSFFSLVSSKGKIYAVEADGDLASFKNYDPIKNEWSPTSPFRNDLVSVSGKLRFAVSIDLGSRS